MILFVKRSLGRGLKQELTLCTEEREGVSYEERVAQAGQLVSNKKKMKKQERYAILIITNDGACVPTSCSVGPNVTPGPPLDGNSR
jgi:hypothetical protein